MRSLLSIDLMLPKIPFFLIILSLRLGTETLDCKSLGDHLLDSHSFLHILSSLENLTLYNDQVKPYLRKEEEILDIWHNDLKSKFKIINCVTSSGSPGSIGDNFKNKYVNCENRKKCKKCFKMLRARILSADFQLDLAYSIILNAKLFGEMSS
jgi:hypothetical protein